MYAKILLLHHSQWLVGTDKIFLSPFLFTFYQQFSFLQDTITEENIDENTLATQETVCYLMESLGLESILNGQGVSEDRYLGRGVAGRDVVWSVLSSVAASWLRAMDPTQDIDRDCSETDIISSPLFSKWRVEGLAEKLMKFTEVKDSPGSGGVRVKNSVLDLQQDNLSKLKAVLGRRYPLKYRPQLFSLPPSYTQLHSQLTAISGYSFPALCLICGAVMDANGKGRCAAHSKVCSKDGGIMFLLQVILMRFLLLMAL